MTRNPRHRARDLFPNLLQPLGLALLCGIGAELLTGYGASTGRPGEVLFALVFFAALYGAPALLAREVAVRAGWGWPSLLPLLLALGVAQASLIDQSLFSADYGGYAGWAEARAAAYLPAFGFSAGQAINFIGGHLIFSFAAPLALAEAWRPGRAGRPWLGLAGLAVAGVAYLGTALMVASETQSHSATRSQAAGAALVVAACLAAAWAMGRPAAPPPRARRIRPPLRAGAVFAATLPLALILDSGLLGGSWPGVGLALAILALVGIGAGMGARRPGWGVTGPAAMGLAFLVARGALAFTDFPLAGTVPAGAKYGHNAVMMATVLTTGWLALRRQGRGPG